MAAQQVVLITGADNGIGLHLTRTLLQDGFRVAALDLTFDNLTQEAESDRLLLRPCDVTDEGQVQGAVAATLARWGALDIAVNNACVAVFHPFAERTVADLTREMEVNYFGYLRLIRAVLPHMLARRSGIIHNVSSGVGITGFPGLTGYTAAKGAIEALTRSLSLELAGTGVHITLMHPPLTNTRSASPLGVPVQAMADPAAIGRKLARKILATNPVITPDFQTAAYLYMARRFPLALGRLFGTLAARGRASQTTL